MVGSFCCFVGSTMRIQKCEDVFGTLTTVSCTVMLVHGMAHAKDDTPQWFGSRHNQRQRKGVDV